MILELTENLIKTSFEKADVDNKYFSVFDKEVKRCYQAFQDEFPDTEECTEDDNNVVISLQLTIDYIKYFVQEVEKGQSYKWAHAYASESVTGGYECNIVRDTYNQLESEEEKEHEFEIHARSILDDPIFYKRYKKLFDEFDCDAKEKAENYTNAYHGCIEDGKSDIYAHAYGLVFSFDYKTYFCEIHAEAYELAIKHGMNDDEAYCFGYFCTEHVDHDLYNFSKFLEKYSESWQKEFYFHLLCKDYEYYYKRTMPENEQNEIKKEICGRKGA